MAEPVQVTLLVFPSPAHVPCSKVGPLLSPSTTGFLTDSREEEQYVDTTHSREFILQCFLLVCVFTNKANECVPLNCIQNLIDDLERPKYVWLCYLYLIQCLFISHRKQNQLVDCHTLMCISNFITAQRRNHFYFGFFFLEIKCMILHLQ